MLKAIIAIKNNNTHCTNYIIYFSINEFKMENGILLKLQSKASDIISNHISDVVAKSFPKTITITKPALNKELYTVSVNKWKEETAIRIASDISTYVSASTRLLLMLILSFKLLGIMLNKKLSHSQRQIN